MSNFSPLSQTRMTIIDRKDSPRYVKKIRLNKHYVHHMKPIMIWDDTMNMYWCEGCGNWVSQKKKEEHEKI
jgi:hypothetical protein